MTRALRVLMIEDSASDATLVAHTLRQGGRSVEYECVDDGASLRMALAQSRWDFVISNWVLPQFSAVAALDILRELGLDVPLIILSDAGGEETAVEAMRAGAREFILKDNLARLGPAVERELATKRARGAKPLSESPRPKRHPSYFAPDHSRETSLAARLRATFTVIGALVALALVSTTLSFAVSWIWIAPALDEARVAGDALGQVSAALLDEETALRGFVLTHDRRFLEPFHAGELALTQAREALDINASPVAALGLGLLRSHAAADRWREQWAQPALRGGLDGAAPSLLDGKVLFDALRSEHASLASAIARRIALLVERERTASALRVGLVLALLTSLLIVVLRQHGALRDAIVAPLAALQRAIARVRDGELITTIDQTGPRELRELGAGLNDMVRALGVARGIAESKDELVRDHANRLRQILDASREFSESLNLAYVVRSVRASTMAVAACEQVTVWLMADDQKGLCDASPFDPAMQDGAIDQSIAWRAAKSGRVTFQGEGGRIRFGDANPGPVRVIVIPLIVGARVVGALEARYGVAHVSSHEAVEVLEMIAAHAATAIESARLNQITEHTSQMDPLTKLCNRRRLEEDLDAECRRSARYGRPLAFVMLDVDHFKAFNDSHGHPQADVALQEVGEVIAGAARTTDTAYRYGGEEFCVLLRETAGESAMIFAERLRQRIELRFATGTMAGLTASFGVAEFSAETPTPRSLVEAADAAMYESKRGGRNRVVRSTPPPTSPADSSGAIAIPGTMRPSAPRAITTPPISVSLRRTPGAA